MSRVAVHDSGTGSNGLPVECDKAELVFVTAQAGWLASACNATSPDVLLVTRDGGARWAPQPLPVPASAFCRVGCEVYSPPQFFGQTGFVVIGQGPDVPHFLASRDLGQTWQPEPLPPGAGWYPRITFFGPRDGVLVSAGASGAIGGVFARPPMAAPDREPALTIFGSTSSPLRSGLDDVATHATDETTPSPRG